MLYLSSTSTDCSPPGVALEQSPPSRGRQTLPSPVNSQVNQRGRVVDWAVRGGLGLLDQVVFSAANFLLHILLLRWLPPQEFGRFALLYAFLLLGGAIHTSVVISPMMVFASGRFSRYRRFYLSQVILGLHAALIAVAAVICFVLLAIPGLHFELALVPIGAVCLYGTWTARQACYAMKSPALALGGSLLYTTVVLTGVVLLHRADALTGPMVFGVIAVAGLAGVALYSFRLSLRLPSLDRRWTTLFVRRHYLYGKWSFGAAVVSRSAGNLFALGLGFFHGFGAIAVLRAAETLMLPIFQLNESLKTLVLPYLVESRRRAHFPRQLLVLGGIAIAMTLSYCGLLVAVYPFINDWILNGKYPHGRAILAILSLSAIAWAAFGPGTAGFKALERPRDIFWPELRGTGIAVVAGFGLTLLFAETGAAAGKVLLIGLPGFLVAASLVRTIRRRGTAAAGGTRRGDDERDD